MLKEGYSQVPSYSRDQRVDVRPPLGGVKALLKPNWLNGLSGVRPGPIL